MEGVLEYMTFVEVHQHKTKAIPTQPQQGKKGTKSSMPLDCAHGRGRCFPPPSYLQPHPALIEKQEEEGAVEYAVADLQQGYKLFIYHYCNVIPMPLTVKEIRSWCSMK